MEQNRFSRQLYYALHSFEIVIPPLRARRNSIPSLIYTRLNSLKKTLFIQPEDRRRRVGTTGGYSWPGNDFELNSIIENIAISSDNGHIRLSNLPDYLFAERPWSGDGIFTAARQPDLYRHRERGDYPCRPRDQWAFQEMSQLLNIGRTILWRKMKQYDIDASQFKRKHLE
ncbi:DNA-binding transcriptional regulator DhaR [Citrobacter braakii]|nr:DNA-binding transcriptional regulator DhaR [Citrobacter braakii]